LLQLRGTTYFGRAMTRAISRRPRTAAAWIRAQVNPVGFVVDKVAGTGFSPISSVFPCQYHSTEGSTFPKDKKNSSFIHSHLH
jgi:hypothetical protein